MTTENPDTLIAKRIHPVLDARRENIRINLLCRDGGQPYIDERLFRYPYESDISWYGAGDGNGATRKDRTSYTNSAGRIVDKVEQYIFKGGIKRDGIDPDFQGNASATGKTVNQVMSDVSQYLTTCGWAWLQIDRDGQPDAIRSMADRERDGDRVFWQAVSPLDVVDWAFDAAGRFIWVLTQGVDYDNRDPFNPGTYQPYRILWGANGAGVKYYIDPKNAEKVIEKEPFATSAGEVPLVLVGNPSAKAWAFDNIELVQMTLLNLESTHREGLIGSAYPQMVLPASMMDSMPQQTMADREESGVKRVVGRKHPITETQEESGISRYLQLSGLAWEAIPEEIKRAQKDMFEIAGQAMKTESRAAQSGDSKAWDHLDTESLIKSRAITLEAAEMKAVSISKQLDSGFKSYVPVYPKSFDISDPESDMRALVGVDALVSTPLAIKEKEKAAVMVMAKIAGTSEETLQAIFDEIDEYEAQSAPVMRPAVEN